MCSYYDQIKELLPDIREEDFRLPVREGSIDSIDLVYIRTILEKNVGELSDKIWNQFATIQEAIDYCHEKEMRHKPLDGRAHHVEISREQEINMPQMANGCLSEHWLFKEIGDIHWSLLCKGLNTSSNTFKNETGARLYATFVRIQVVLQYPLSIFAENERLQLEGSLKRFGNSTYICQLQGNSSRKGIQATLMTTFSAREEDNNTRLFKSSPLVSQNTVPEYWITPVFLSDYRRMKKGLLQCFEVKNTLFKLTDAVIYETIYEINPFYEINGVGLIYFAAYPVISDVCEARYFNAIEGNEWLWECRYSTVLRDIFYFSNCDRRDKIIYQLNSIENLADGRVKICSSLFRHSDKALMARLFSVKG